MKEIAKNLLLCIVVILTTFCLSSCKAVKYVDKIHTEYVHKVDTLMFKDSVYVHDSISTYIKGDTIFIDKFKLVYKDKWRNIVKVDTICKTDSIPYTVTVTKEVSNGREPLYIMVIVLLVIIIGFLVRKNFYS